MNGTSRLALALMLTSAAGTSICAAEVIRLVEALQPAKADAEPAKEEKEPDKNRPDERFLQLQRVNRDNSKQAMAAGMAAMEVNLGALIQLKLDGKFLDVDAGGNNATQSQRHRIKGTQAYMTLTHRSVAAAGMRPASTSISATRVDTDVETDEEIWTSSLSRSSTYLSLSGQSVLGRVSFSQRTPSQGVPVVGAAAAPPIRLAVYEWQVGGRQQMTFSAAEHSIEDLRANHPEAFRKYAVPLFRKFSDLSWLLPGATDVYAVFGEVRPDEAVVEQLEALLPELDSPSYAVREAAARELMNLGPAGVLAALRTDPDGLTDEQKGQLGRLIAAHRRRGITDPAAALKDTNFLTDCLEHPDAAVRQAALAALNKALGTEVEFDYRLSGEALTAAADAVRKKVRELIPATQPADQPAEDANAPKPALVRPRILIR